MKLFIYSKEYRQDSVIFFLKTYQNLVAAEGQELMPSSKGDTDSFLQSMQWVPWLPLRRLDELVQALKQSLQLLLEQLDALINWLNDL